MKTDHRRRGALTRLVARLRADSRGNVAMIFALGLPALVMLCGMGVDLYRADVARNTSQQAIDAAALAAASSKERTQAGLARVASNYMKGNVDLRYLETAPDPDTKFIDDIKVEVTMQGKVKTLFMGMIGVSEMPVNVTATAIRGAAEEVELALVLDNTWSMSDMDGRGVRKIDALKVAARDLVNELMQRDGARVKIGVVPYADYVNVGTQYRGQPWLTNVTDYETAPTARVCTMISTRTVCTGAVTIPKTCTRQIDGVPETYSCPTTDRTNEVCRVENITPYQSCSGGTTTKYQWFGCVVSRKQDALRLDDSRPEVAYEGMLQTSQTCLNPIVALTNQRATVLTAIQNLIVNRGTSYRPLTHIPSGLIWGVNVVSPTAPFSEGKAYHVSNRDPRKIIVLMTDGENTLRFTSGDGKHVAPSGTAAQQAAQLTATNNDTQAICTYAKSRKIEVFTVALAVNSTTARRMLQDCASDASHYFDASDTAALADAFQEIAASINKVRLIN